MNYEILRHCRCLVNLTQKELAEKVGVNHSLISKYETGALPVNKQIEARILQVYSDEGLSVRDVLQIQMIFNKYKGV